MKPRLWRIDPYLTPQPAGDEFPSLEWLQGQVGGQVQYVPCINGDQAAILFINEDGKERNLQSNLCATAVLYARVQREAGRKSYSNYAIDNPFECVPETFNDLVVGVAFVWIGPLPRNAVN